MTDILWVGYPKSYTKGRRRKPQVVILHYTAGSEGPTSAEGGAAYDKRRTDGTSTHYFTDSLGPALQEVPDGDRAHTARVHGNEIGINIEICGTVQTRSQWLDPASLATLRTTAALVAILLGRHGFAFQRLSTAELRRAYYSDPNITGVVDHNACTEAFPEDGGTHTDVGAAFPWDVFLGMVAAELRPTTGDNMQRIARDPATHQHWMGDGIWRRKLTDQNVKDWRAAGIPYDGDQPDMATYGLDIETSTGAGLSEAAVRDIAVQVVSGTTLTPPA